MTPRAPSDPATSAALPPAPPPSLLDRVASAAFLGLIRSLRLLPYDRRIPAMGWMFSHLLAPVAGWRKRIRENLALARPDLPGPEIDRLTRAVPDNAGRAMMEIYSGAEFTARIIPAALTGPGLPALEEAAATSRPVIIACAHFGNYDAMRAALSARGWPVGALYRPMNNAAFNAHYIPAIHAIAQPLFPRSGKAGLTGMIRFLRKGGMLCLGFDQFDRHGETLRFFGLPSETVLTPAELALKYDALLVPVAGIRQPDGLSFRVQVGVPIAPSTAPLMMQALNDDLETLVRAHMDQWFWVHRRWKAPRKSAAQIAADDPPDAGAPAAPASAALAPALSAGTTPPPPAAHSGKVSLASQDGYSPPRQPYSRTGTTQRDRMSDQDQTRHHEGDVAFIQALAELLNRSELTELSVEREYGENDRLTVQLAKQSAPVVMQAAPYPQQAPAYAPAPAAAAAAPAAAAPEGGGDPASLPGAVTSPMVGTAYLSAEPGAAPFVTVGQTVAEGETLMIVEAMKTMNHIPAPRAGTVRRILVEDGSPVEFGTPLMVVE